MQKYTFSPVAEKPQVEINGIVFDILKLDFEVIKQVTELQNKYMLFTSGKETLDVDQITTLIQDIHTYIDEMIGAGAVAKICGDVELSLAKSIELMVIVSQAAVKELTEDITHKYG